MAFKKWVIKDTDKELAKQLAIECEIEPFLAFIALARGYDDPADLEQFFSNEPCFSDSYSLADIMHAADIINKFIVENKKIAIFGDYDCDGVTATALLYNYLKERNVDCIYYIPDRFSEGYGMNCNAIRYLHSVGAELIITVDNGIACIDEIELANQLGITVIVTDHHLPGEILPNAAAVVDPHRKDCPSDFKSVCGAEVAFKLICVMEGKEPEELLPYYADILAVAVIADVMPLNYENRSIVKYGVEKLKKSPLTGLSALLNVSGVNISTVSAEKIAFSICPRLNAAGRMGDAKKAVELLCENDMLKALNIANEIEHLNTVRQQTEKTIFAEAVKKIENNNLTNDRIIVIDGENWHHGVVGIVAARICERYGTPCIVLSVEGDTAHGSGRSFDGFSLFDAVNSCRDLLFKFGGHSLACGVSLYKDNIEEFRNKINEYAYSLPMIAPTLQLDCKLNPSALTLDLTESLKQLEPFGFNNQMPIFGLFGVTLQRVTPLSNNKHLKLLFSKNSSTFCAVLFGIGTDAFCFEVGDVLDLAITAETNVYNGNSNVSIQIKAIRVSGTDDEKLFSDLDNYKMFLNEKSFYAKSITPTRQEIGDVYRYISKTGIAHDKIIYHFINSLGYGKTSVSLLVLTDLGLINKSNDIYYSMDNVAKTNLSNSEIYNFLLKECEHN